MFGWGCSPARGEDAAPPGGVTTRLGVRSRQVRPPTPQKPDNPDMKDGAPVRVRAEVTGTVQGVGFRPFVHALATQLGLAGQVGNHGAGVWMEVEGPPAAVDDFLTRLSAEAPPLARIGAVTVTPLSATGAPADFTIVASRSGGAATLVPPDVATCEDCLRELADPADRRYRHPFITCTQCGPRFTIVTALPYDRPRTTMAEFRMCAACQREYRDPTDRRFHAQPVCCPDCGPQLSLVDAEGKPLPGEPLAAAVARLRAGQIVAIKGLGGYHLACLATDPAAVATLRDRKHRPAKPFAVMVPDLATARTLAHPTPADEALLTDPRRPVVLLPRRNGSRLAEPVAPGLREVGVLLPYTPLHHLLVTEVAAPLVMTSGNRSGEPILHRDEDALAGLASVADAFLTHDRPIHAPADDSVARTVRGRPLLLRRSRGYVPEPLTVPWRFPRPVLACGADLKNTFALAQGYEVICSAHIGDLADHPTFQSYLAAIAHLTRLTGCTPQVLAHDLHPEYHSTRYALAQQDVDLVGVQHHHAHIAACLADNRHTGPVIGVALDGTGYGTDGTLWGGELLVADLATFTRVGHLTPVPLPGGETAIRQPWRMAVSYLHAACPDGTPEELPLLRRHPDWPAVRQLASTGLAPLTSSAGRLCDAVAALLGVREEISYEGQAAIELEQRADPTVQDGYRLPVTDSRPLRLSGPELFRQVLDDLQRGTPVPVIAARFHHGLVDGLAQACQRVRERTGLATVALSGGVFQNQLLLTGLRDRLTAAGFRVLTHRDVPPNDGGICVGQAVVAAAGEREPPAEV